MGIVAEDVWSSNNAVGLSVLSNVRLKGEIAVSNLTVDGTRPPKSGLGAGIKLVDQSVDGAMVTIRDSLVRGVSSASPGASPRPCDPHASSCDSGVAPITFARHAPPKPSRALEFGRVALENLTVSIDECEPFLLANLSRGCFGSSGTGRCGPIELFSLVGSFTVLAPPHCDCPPPLIEAAGNRPKHWNVSVRCIKAQTAPASGVKTDDDDDDPRELGIDTSTWEHPWPQAGFECLRKNASFLVVEGYRSKPDISGGAAGGHVVTTAPQTVRNALAAGFRDISIYHFPDTAIDPAVQIHETVRYFASENVSFNTLFLDIEGPEYWNKSCSVNVAFLHGMVAAARSLLGPERVGIYASESQWKPIMCGDATFSSIPLWYAHWDEKPDFDDFHEAGIGPFGGWSKPTMKQYHGSVRACGVNVDLNYRPHKSDDQAQSDAVAGPEMSVEVFKPNMTSVDGTVCQCLRLPAVVLDRANGWHLAFAECRHDVGDSCVPSGVASTAGGTDIALRISRTQGRSWGPMTIVAKQAGHPTPTYDAVRKSVVLQFNQFEEKACTSGRHGNCTAFSYNKTGPGEPLLNLRGCCPNFQVQSSDGGVSWGPWQAVEPTNAVAWPARVGSGTGIQLRPSNPHKPGRLLNVGWHLVQPPSQTWVATIRNSFDAIFFSDSGGQTWHQPEQSRQLNASCNEAQLAEMPNGDVLAIMRQSSPVK